MRPSRGKSNPKVPLPSQQLELETKKMEEKLAYLKAQMEVEKKKKEDQLRTSGSRWKTSTTTQPIKNYANVVMEAKKIQNTTAKLDYTKMNKEFGEKMAQKSSLKNTSNSSMSQIQQRPSSKSSSTSMSRQKENENDLNKSLNNNNTQSSSQLRSSKGLLERRNSKDSRLPQKQSTTTNSTATNSTTTATQANNNQGLCSELSKILEELNLIRYQEQFINLGYSTADKIKDLNNEVLNKIGIPPGFQIKLMKKINSLSSEIQQTNSPTKEIKEIETNEKITIKKSALTNITPRVKIQQQKSLLEESKNNNNNNSQQQKVQQQSKPPLMNNINKQQQQQNQNQQTQQLDQKQVRFEENNNTNNKKEINKPKIKQSDDKSGKQMFHTESTDVQTPSEFIINKLSCWQCYSIVTETTIISAYYKSFCSSHCLKLYEDYYIVECNKKDCGKKVSKQESSFREGNWYCMGKCEPNIEQIEQMWSQQEQDIIEQKDNNETEEEFYNRKYHEFENIDKQRKIEYDLKLSSINNKSNKVLSLQDIEAKYKIINQEQNIS